MMHLPTELLLLAFIIVPVAQSVELDIQHDSPAIIFSSLWGESDDHSISSVPEQTFALIWHGTGLSVYGRVDGNPDALNFTVDNFAAEPTQTQETGIVYQVQGLPERDHQLLMTRTFDRRFAGVTFFLEKIELRNDAIQDSGPEVFRPAFFGTAADFTRDSQLSDDRDFSISLSGQWTSWLEEDTQKYRSNAFWFRGSARETVFEDCALSMTFPGSKIWIYGTKYPSGGKSEVRIDGRFVGMIDSAGYEIQAPLFVSEDLEDTDHVLEVITRDCPTRIACGENGCTEACLSIDFFRTLGGTITASMESSMEMISATVIDPEPTDAAEAEPGEGEQQADDFFPNPGPDEPALIAGAVGGILFVLLTSVATLAWKKLFAID